MSLGEPWAITARANNADHLELGGIDVTDLVHEFGTPLYVFDHATLVDHAVRAKKAFAERWANTTILYATKAYFSPFLARFYRDLDLGLDVTSEAELEIARRVDFPCDKIYLHGNNKTWNELRAALAMGVRHVVVDNHDEIELLASAAVDADAEPKVLIRVTPGIDPHTHEYLTTGVVESKFGLPISTGDAARAARRVLDYPQLELVGLHAHLGSQIFEAGAWRKEAQVVLNFAGVLKRRFDIEFNQIDLGGGWGVTYSDRTRSVPFETVAETILAGLSAGIEAENLSSDLHLLVEPGRALIAQAGVALYSVGGVKSVHGARTYVCVDGGMGDNIRPALYDAEYIARVANKFHEMPVQDVAIAGRYCEQGDILIRETKLPRVRPGDLIAIPNAGAYQIPMASNYNMIPRPPVVLVGDGHATLLRRRETIDDLLACDVIE